MTAIVRDRTSNRVLISLGDSVAAGLDPAVADYVRNAWAQEPTTRIDPLPEGDVPSYLARPASPAIPTAPGIALALDRVSEARPGMPSILHGAYHVPVVPHDTNIGHGLLVGPAGGPKRAPTAVAGITLLSTTNQEPGPRVRQLLVPSFEPVVRTSEGS